MQNVNTLSNIIIFPLQVPKSCTCSCDVWQAAKRNLRQVLNIYIWFIFYWHNVLARSLCYCFSFLMDHSASKGTESNQTLCMVHLLCIKCSKGLFGTVINTSTLIHLFSQGTCIYCLLSGSRVCCLCTRESREGRICTRVLLMEPFVMTCYD